MSSKTAKEKLYDAYGRGDLRYWLETKLDDEALELLLEIVGKRCEPKRKRK